MTRKDLHAEWPIGISSSKAPTTISVSFLERVSKFPRIINVGNINITAREQQTAGATVSAECTATAFVLMAPEEKPDAKGKRQARQGREAAKA